LNKHGEWLKFVSHAHMPFGKGMREMYMRIASNKNLMNAQHVALLPPYVGTLDQLEKLPDRDFKQALERGHIFPEMKRSDARSLYLKTLKQERIKKAAAQNVGTEISLWLADPPWDPTFRLPYATMELEDIKNLRLGDDGEASTDPKYRTVAEASARCAAIGMWAIDELLHQAEEVLEAWDFKLLTPRIIWHKGSHANEGRAAYHAHEYLLIGVRGGAEVKQKFDSVVPIPRTSLKNSEKPVRFYSMLEEMFPYLTKRKELFARRYQPGWSGWGNEYPGEPKKDVAA
jgi:N6-adenosine-specific RNA methylase IME4